MGLASRMAAMNAAPPGAMPGGAYPPAGVAYPSAGGYPPIQGGPGAHPPQQAAYPQPAAPAPPPPIDIRQAIYQRLVGTIQRNGISAFYTQERLNQVLDRAVRVDYNALAQRWRLPSLELALDLASLALYDTVMLCDDSGSMKYQQDGVRITSLKAVVEKITEVAALFDDDGLVIRFLNSKKTGDNLRSSVDALALIDRLKFDGSTPIGEMLNSKILKPIVYKKALKKPVLVICITDGAPDNTTDVLRVMLDCKQKMSATPGGTRAVAFEFAQVGNDMAAMEWLATLDNNPQIGDIVDVTSNYEAEEMEWKRKHPNNQLTPGLWLLKLMLGAIDPQYDGRD